MYLRFIHVEIDESRLTEMADFYRTRILSTLRQVPSCSSATLFQSTTRPDHCISLTVWHDDQAASTWLESKANRQILAEARPLLRRSISWRGSLSGSALPDSAIRAFTVEAGTDLPTGPGNPEPFVLRMTSFRVADGRWDRLVELYDQKVAPTLMSVEGCQAAFLVESLEDPDHGLSVSVWNREEDAVRYEISGRFDALTRSLRETLIPTHRWREAWTPEGSADGNPPVESFRMVVGERYPIS